MRAQLEQDENLKLADSTSHAFDDRQHIDIAKIEGI